MELVNPQATCFFRYLRHDNVEATHCIARGRQFKDAEDRVYLFQPGFLLGVYIYRICSINAR